MKLIVPPSLLTNPYYLRGLHQPLEEIADTLDEQDKHGYARALRHAAEIVRLYVILNIDKTGVLHESTTTNI